MKNIFFATLGVATLSMASAASYMRVELENGTVVKYDVDSVKVVDFEIDKEIDPFVDGHEYVDLGLTSGTKWALMNIGANDTTEAGTHYAWGEVVSKDKFPESGSETYGIDIAGLEEKGYIVNGILTPKYDVANVEMGEHWSMPTKTQFEELLSECTWVFQENPRGYVVFGPNGKTLFFPNTGVYDKYGDLKNPQEGEYYSSEAMTDTDKEKISSYVLRFSDEYVKILEGYRYYGRVVRGVTK